MVRDIKIHPPTPLMPLYQLVPPKRITPRIHILKLSRRSLLPTPPQAMTPHIILTQQLLLQLLIQIVKRLPCVRKIRVPTHAPRRQRVCPQQTETRPAWIEGRIDVEERVALAKVVAPCADLGDGAVVLEVRDVEDLVMCEAIFAAEGYVGFDLCVWISTGLSWRFGIGRGVWHTSSSSPKRREKATWRSSSREAWRKTRTPYCADKC